MIPPDHQRSDGVQAWLVTGPPFGGELYRDVRARIGPGATTWVAADPAAPGGWRDDARRLAADLRAAGPVVLVGHGLGVPVALAAAQEHAPAALVLSDGPITRLDPVTAALARLARRSPALVASLVLRPALWTRWLASSAGLRRAVVNPYVMDRDTVAAIAGPLVADPAARVAVATFLASVGEGLPPGTAPACPTVLAWGTGDALYPPSEADFMASSAPGVRHVSIDGGQWVHPVERPWALADLVREACDVAGARARS